MDIAALVISIVAIVVSVVIFIIELFTNKRINDINLISSFMNTIYEKHLISNIPNARKMICFSDNKLSGISNLQHVLNQIRQDSLYFKYSDEQFFNELKKECQELEDYIVENEGKKFEYYEQPNVNKKIEKSIESIYAIINKKYTSG